DESFWAQLLGATLADIDVRSHKFLENEGTVWYSLARIQTAMHLVDKSAHFYTSDAVNDDRRARAISAAMGFECERNAFNLNAVTFLPLAQQRYQILAEEASPTFTMDGPVVSADDWSRLINAKRYNVTVAIGGRMRGKADRYEITPILFKPTEKDPPGVTTWPLRPSLEGDYNYMVKRLR
ncbi:hypothetical protein GGF31_004020, partial [Allomyces arbusculus]